MDILAVNPMATALSPLLTPGRNAILDAFTEPEMRELHRGWDDMTTRLVPYLRSVAGPDADDPRLTRLVGELSLRSDRFRALWARHDVRHKSTGTSHLRHPEAGDLELRYEKLLIPATDMQTLVTYHADPGSDTEERLRLLATISAPAPKPVAGKTRAAAEDLGSSLVEAVRQARACHGSRDLLHLTDPAPPRPRAWPSSG
jgi:hypothetical protein